VAGREYDIHFWVNLFVHSIFMNDNKFSSRNIGDYRLTKKLGHGAFGEAYLGLNIQKMERVVVKIIDPAMLDINTVKREALLMQILCGGPNIIKVYDLLQEAEHGYPAIVLEYINAVYYKELYPTLNASDIQYYMKEFLIALKYMHEHVSCLYCTRIIIR
jgi:casein kinase II subunit alpha